MPRFSTKAHREEEERRGEGEGIASGGSLVLWQTWWKLQGSLSFEMRGLIQLIYFTHSFIYLNYLKQILIEQVLKTPCHSLLGFIDK